MQSKNLTWLPSLGWMFAVYLALTREIDPDAVSWLPEHADKVVHFTFFAVMAWLIRWPLTLNTSWRTGIIIVVSFLLTTIYGAWTEWLQSTIPHRTADWNDIVANTLGAATVLLSTKWTRLKSSG